MLIINDVLLKSIMQVLYTTGIVSGEFGFVDHYRKRKDEIASWITDDEGNVRAFAASFVHLLDQMIADELRRL